jgi:hypothetical protein
MGFGDGIDLHMKLTCFDENSVGSISVSTIKWRRDKLRGRVN